MYLYFKNPSTNHVIDFKKKSNRYPTSNGVHPDVQLAPQLPPRDNQVIQRAGSTYGSFNQPSYGASPMYNSYSNPSSYFNGYSNYSSPYNGSSMMNSSNYGIGNNSNRYT